MKRSTSKMDEDDKSTSKRSNDRAFNGSGVGAAVNLSGTDAGHDYGDVTMAVSNITRSWTAVPQAVNETPAWVLQLIYPNEAFISGWSANTETIDSNDHGAAWDLSKEGTNPLYGITPLAKYFQSFIWPVIENLFQSGVGSRYTIGLAEFVRHQVLTLTVHRTVKYILWLNYMTYHFDWKAVFPFSGEAPPALYILAKAMKCSDIELVELWMPIIKRVEVKSAFPNMITWTNRMLTPNLSSVLTGRVVIAGHANMTDTAGGFDKMYNACIDRLNYIDTNLDKADGIMKSFLPYTVASALPWSMGPVTMDVNRHTGMWNSGRTSTNAFGDGDVEAMVVSRNLIAEDTPTTARIPLLPDIRTSVDSFASRYAQPIWDEMRTGAMYATVNPSGAGLDTIHRLLTNVVYGSTLLYGNYHDTDDLLVFAGEPTSSDDWRRYRRFFETKFVGSTVDGGTRDPEYVYSPINIDTLQRLINLETEYLFSFQVLRYVSTATSGNSLRDLRGSIADIVTRRQ